MEMAADRLYKEKKIRGFCHLSTGQEAVATGIEHAITKDDSVITAYRCHGFALMRGGTVKSIIGELLGRRHGIAYGKGGSMHVRLAASVSFRALISSDVLERLLWWQYATLLAEHLVSNILTAFRRNRGRSGTGW